MWNEVFNEQKIVSVPKSESDGQTTKVIVTKVMFIV